MESITLNQAFDSAIAMEQSARRMYLELAAMFADTPGAAAFFRTFADDEAEHERLLRDIRSKLAAGRLAEPASPLLAASLRSAAQALSVDVHASVSTLGDAYSLTHSLENGELLAAFRVLAVETITDAQRREFLAAQIDRHVEKINALIAGPGRYGRMDSFPRG